MDAIQRYQSIEAAHRAAAKTRLAKTYRVVRPDASEAEISQAVEDPEASSQIFTQTVSFLLRIFASQYLCEYSFSHQIVKAKPERPCRPWPPAKGTSPVSNPP